jgi:hypothetical protein
VIRKHEINTYFGRKQPLTRLRRTEEDAATLDVRIDGEYVN